LKPPPGIQYNPPVVTEPTTSLALDVSGLGKSYRVGPLHTTTSRVLDALTLSVPRGEIFGYLGPNGSGKTTTLKILMGLVYPDSGSASLLGFPLGDPGWRYQVGYLPEHPYFYDYLTPREYLDFVGTLFSMPRSHRRDRSLHLLELVGLARSLDIPLRRFSKGMLQRVGLAQALMNDPALLILDEPMSGLDPMGRRLVRNLILSLHGQGKTVFFSTHILSDAETLCQRVGVLRAGRLLKVGRLDEILNINVAHMEVLVSGLDEAALKNLPEGVLARQALGERWRLEVAEESLGRVLAAIEERRGRLLSVQPIRASLEDYFVREMGPQAGGAWTLED
jgi:ABC-2 type transport system ATP-binding protein